MILDPVGGRATSLRDGLKFLHYWIKSDEILYDIGLSLTEICTLLDQVGGRATSLRDGLKFVSDWIESVAEPRRYAKD